MIESLLLSYYLYHVQLPAQIQAESEGQGRGHLTVELRQSPLRSVQPGTQRVPHPPSHCFLYGGYFARVRTCAPARHGEQQ